MATDHSHSSVKCASPARLRGLDIRDADFGQDCCENNCLSIDLSDLRVFCLPFFSFFYLSF